MKKRDLTTNIRWLALTVIGLAIGLGALAQAQTTPAPAATAGVSIILVDRNAFFSESSAGQDVARQVQDLQKTISADLNGRAQKLKTEEEQLVSQQAVLTQEAFQEKAEKLGQQRLALQQEADQKNQQMQQAIFKAQNQITQAVSPILDAILKEKRASLMLDRAAVVKGSVDLDVTATALQRLNEKMPALKVEFAPAQASAPKPAAPGAKPQEAPKPKP